MFYIFKSSTGTHRSWLYTIYYFWKDLGMFIKKNCDIFLFSWYDVTPSKQLSESLKTMLLTKIMAPGAEYEYQTLSSVWLYKFYLRNKNNLNRGIRLQVGNCLRNFCILHSNSSMLLNWEYLSKFWQLDLLWRCQF